MESSRLRPSIRDRHNERQHVKGIDKYFSIFLAWLPIISIYKSGVPGLTIADVILGLFLGYSLFFSTKKSRKIKSGAVIFALYCVYICTLPLVMSIAYEREYLADILVRMVRIIFYIVCGTVLSRKHLNTQVYKTWLVRVSVLAVVYILVQYALYNLYGYYLVGYLPFLDVYQSGYMEVDYLSIFETHFFRPTSFFLEPAHCARYLVLGLMVSLFNKEAQKEDYIRSIVIMGGILLTTSGQGIALVGIILFCFLFLNKTSQASSKNFTRKFVLLCLVGVIFLVLLLTTNVIQNTVLRLFNNSSNGALSYRLGTFFEVLEQPPMFLILGHGYGAVPYKNAWMSGITYVLYGSGIIGLIILLAFFVGCFRSSRVENKIAAIIFFFLFITDDAFNSYMLVIYLSTILYYSGDMCEKSLVYRNRN